MKYEMGEKYSNLEGQLVNNCDRKLLKVQGLSPIFQHPQMRQHL